MDKSNYSVQGYFPREGKFFQEERTYQNATSIENALELAKEDGCIGPGMVFHNLGLEEQCVAGSEPITLESIKKFLSKE